MTCVRRLKAPAHIAHHLIRLDRPSRIGPQFLGQARVDLDAGIVDIRFAAHCGEVFERMAERLRFSHQPMSNAYAYIGVPKELFRNSGTNGTGHGKSPEQPLLMVSAKAFELIYTCCDPLAFIMCSTRECNS